MTCTNSIPKDKLPKLIGKLEFFMFQAIKEDGLDLFKLSESGFADKQRLLRAVYNKDKGTGIIPNTILQYEKAAKRWEEEDEDTYEQYIQWATNLKNLLGVWDELVLNFHMFSKPFKSKVNFKLNEEGTVDMTEFTDENVPTYGMIDFDVQANEVDPMDIDKNVELFIRSIQKIDPRIEAGEVYTPEFDEYGYSVAVDYQTFVRGMLADLENTTTFSEQLERLKQKVSSVPEYQVIIDSLEYTGPDKNKTRMREAFKGSFAKALVPIMTTTIDNGTVKVYETTIAKRTMVERIAASNFQVYGMEIEVGEDSIQLAHQDNNDSWILDSTDLPKIKNFIEKSTPSNLKQNQIKFLKGLGFEFSKGTEESLLNGPHLGPRERVGDSPSFWYLYDHLVRSLETGAKTTNPLEVIKKDNKVERKKRIAADKGQTKFINDLIELEIINNREYNVERSVLNTEGKRQHAQQDHTGFTIMNKYYSDADQYPTLESIYTQPSMEWLNPETNVAIRNSILFKSLFFTDPTDPNYGKRRRVTTNEKGTLVFSATEGTPTSISIVNNNGAAVKTGEDKIASTTTSLSKVSKIIQDIGTFLNKGYKSTLRLGDKSTDLGIYMNYYLDETTGLPVNRPVTTQVLSNVFATSQFQSYIKGALIDTVSLRYLSTKGFLEEFKMASKNLKSTWGFFTDDKLLPQEFKTRIDNIIKAPGFTVDKVQTVIDSMMAEITPATVEYFEEYHKNFMKLLAPVAKILPVRSMIGRDNLSENVKYYLANAVVFDIEQMKMFFGDPVFYKDPHKRFSAVSASGKFTSMDENLIEELNDYSDNKSYGFNSNLSARMLLERISDKLDPFQKIGYSARHTIGKSFTSAVIKEVEFSSKQAKVIPANIEKLQKLGFLSEAQVKLYNDSIKDVIIKSYSELQKEADGQGKCSFDFYRTISIATNEWSIKQEDAYRKIVMYYHYTKLLENPNITEEERADLLDKKNKVGYEQLSEVYFPPKKFQYSGTQQYEKVIDEEVRNMYIQVFDKFSLQPLIPTLIHGTSDEELAMRMDYEGVGYVKFESGTKVEVPKNTDSLYDEFDTADTDNKKITSFEERLAAGTTKFVSEQELFFDFLKEQVKIDSTIHETVTFGTQMRKLMLMNILSKSNNFQARSEFKKLYEDYKNEIKELANLEKKALYTKLGITETNGKVSITNMKKMIEFFLKEIDKKDQDSNVRKALEYNEETGTFKIPLDAATQAQVIEGIIVSAFNNSIVNYKTNGSMLTQVATTGNESKRYSSKMSRLALAQYGNTNLNYYDVLDDGTVTQMEVKIGLTGQWKNLLNLTDNEGITIATRQRLNEMLKDEQWVKKNRNSIEMIAYRIPTQGRNFLDSMIIKEFLPEEMGDAIIMPSEVVIKSGSDFDIDKMFVFYPNLKQTGAAYEPTDTDNPKAVAQNKLYKTMHKIILHPSNYMELVTPSTNFHIEPIIDKIYDKLGLKKEGETRPKTDYKNTELINEILNMAKFESLLKGKKDLGIAAIANTFNVLFQLSGASSHKQWLEDKKIISFFNNKNVTKNKKESSYAGEKVEDITQHLGVTSIDFGDIYDETGMIKSEFFSEFINAFVDVAKDDYVFNINAVTELTPLMFYMKYMGLSSEKIMYFINQPIIRKYIENLTKYESIFVRAKVEEDKERYSRMLRSLEMEDLNEADKDEIKKKLEQDLEIDERSSISIRNRARQETLNELGIATPNIYSLQKKNIYDNLLSMIGTSVYSLNSLQGQFEENIMFENIKPINTGLNTLNSRDKTIQLAYFIEFINLKTQADSLTEAQRMLNFDTNPYTSSFDVYQRDKAYSQAMTGKNILSPQTIEEITKNSVISPLNIGKEISTVLTELMPVRNDVQLNDLILSLIDAKRSNPNDDSIRSQDDILSFARIAKNDFNQYLLQNWLGEKGTAYFQDYFNTTKSFNNYLADLIDTKKLSEQRIAIKNLEYYDELVERFPIIGTLIIESGKDNPLVKSMVFLKQGNNILDREANIRQFLDIVSSKGEIMKPVREFFKDIGLYAAFQGGMNTSDVSYTNIVPIEILNTLIGYASENFKKLTNEQKLAEYKQFIRLFSANNPVLFGSKNKLTLTQESSKKGKWFNMTIKPALKPNKIEATTVTTTQRARIGDKSFQNISTGKKTLLSLPARIEQGAWTLSNNNQEVNTVLILDRKVHVGSLSEKQRDKFAIGEGFSSWRELEEKVYSGQGENITKAFVEGTQELFSYRVSVPGLKTAYEEKKGGEESPKSELVEQTEKVLEGDIFQLEGIPVITTNLGGVHGAGLAQTAKAKGLVNQGDGAFKATDKVVQLPVKKVWSDSMGMNNNMELLKSSLRSLITTAKANPDKTYLLPLAGLGHGEGSIEDILPLLIKTIQVSGNIKLILPAEGISLGRQGTVRKDYTRENMPKIKQMLSEAGLIAVSIKKEEAPAPKKETPISKWAKENNVSLTKTEEEIVEDYINERLTPSETLEEFLTRNYCSGKL